jgi:hypothetical protein
MRFNVYDNLEVVGCASLDPQDSLTANTGVAVYGKNVDTEGYDNAALYAILGLPNASTTAFNAVFVLQESADGVTGWSSALDNTGAAIGFTLTSPTTITGTPVATKFVMTVSSVAGLYIGQEVSGVDIPVGTVITAINGLVLTLSAAATGSPGSEALAFSVEGVARVEGLGLNRKRFLRVVATPTQVRQGQTVAAFSSPAASNT